MLFKSIFPFLNHACIDPSSNAMYIESMAIVNITKAADLTPPRLNPIFRPWFSQLCQSFTYSVMETARKREISREIEV